MNESEERKVQREASEAILDIGVSLPLKEFRIPFRKKPVRFRITMRRPRLSGQMCIGRIYLRLGATYEEVTKFTKEEEMRFLVEHGTDISFMIAYTICRGPISRRLYVRPVAWFLRECVEHRFLLASVFKFVFLMGTDSFIDIIRSAERTNPMKLRLSRKKKGS